MRCAKIAEVREGLRGYRGSALGIGAFSAIPPMSATHFRHFHAAPARKTRKCAKRCAGANAPGDGGRSGHPASFFSMAAERPLRPRNRFYMHCSPTNGYGTFAIIEKLANGGSPSSRKRWGRAQRMGSDGFPLRKTNRMRATERRSRRPERFLRSLQVYRSAFQRPWRLQNSKTEIGFWPPSAISACGASPGFRQRASTPSSVTT